MSRHAPLHDRFLSRFERRGDDECWPWTAGTSKAGYGLIGVGGAKVVYAHRLAYETAHGQIPDGLVVCHRCDTPRCVNPAHLFLGTQAENLADMRAKGRAVFPRSKRGNKYSAKLTAEQVDQIRSALGTQQKIGEQFGVSASTVGFIKSGKTWKEVKPT